MSKHIVIDARIRRSSTGRYVDRLVDHLQNIDREHRYTVLVQPDDHWQPTAANFARYDASFPQFSFNPLHQIQFTRLLNRLKPDLVHFPMNQQPLLYTGVVVTTTMDLTMFKIPRPKKSSPPVFWLKMAGYRLIFWWSNKKSKAIITITDFVKCELEEKFDFARGKITTAHCASEPPISAAAQVPEALSKFYAPSSKFQFIFYVGTALPHKNLEKLVDAFGLLKQKHPDLHLVLSGKREYYYEQLEKYVHDSSVRDINITGFVTDQELKWLYQNAEAYVFPSLSEGFGLPGLEAMVHGLPVVSSNATCLPEILGNAAEYFDPNDADDIAAKIDKVLRNKKLRADLIKRGYVQTKKFSWHKMAKEVLSVYRSVLGE